MIRRIQLIVTLLFTCALCNAQVNLVRNPGFEQYSQCPTSFDQITFAYHWSAIDSDGINSCVPEFCSSCTNIGPGSVPDNGYFFQYPHSGNGLAQVTMFFDNSIVQTQPFKRDYLQGRLNVPLTIGQSYCVSFYTNLTEISRYAVDRIGAYFDDGSIDTASMCWLPQTQYTPQVQNAPGNIIIDTANWIKIEGSFIANGTEKFITIGNFFETDETSFIELPDNSFNYLVNDNYSYYLVDDVSVIPSDLPAYAGPDVWVALGDSIFIGRPPEVGLECKWYVGGNVVDSGGGIWVHPTVTTTYVVEQTLCGLVKTDTVTVSVFPVGVNGMTNSRQLSVYPNPASAEVTVYCERAVFSQCTIVNSVGQFVSSHALSEKETRIDIGGLPGGVYYLQLYGDKGREVRSFVKM